MIEKLTYICPTLIILSIIIGIDGNPAGSIFFVGVWVGIMAIINAAWKGLIK